MIGINYIIRDLILDLIIPIVLIPISAYLFRKYFILKKEGIKLNNIKIIASGFLIISISFLLKIITLSLQLINKKINLNELQNTIYTLSQPTNILNTIPMIIFLIGILCLFSVSFKGHNKLSLITLSGIIIINSGFLINITIKQYLIYSTSLLAIIGINEIIKNYKNKTNSLMLGISYIILSISFASFILFPDIHEFYAFGKITRILGFLLIAMLFTNTLLKKPNTLSTEIKKNK